MFNEPDFFWKNFRLGTELQISGTHIFNALYFFDKLEYINYEEDIFEFLYNVSVGVERVQKIAIILLTHNINSNQKDFEKNLITHNHLELNSRITEIKKLNFGKSHKKFLNLISDFYNSYRYSRFNKSSVYHKNFDKYKFLEFISTELEIEQLEDYIENTPRVKAFIGKIISKIVCDYYSVIKEQAYEIGTFTYEIRYESKAFKIFIAKEYTFETENNLKKEIIIGLIRHHFKDEFMDYIHSIEPVNLEDNNSSYYIKYLLNNFNNSSVLEEYEYLLDEKKIHNERKEIIDPIGQDHYLSED